MNIVLTGFMASGKTAVGRKIAETASMPFIDTDAMIEEQTKMTVAQIFKICGEYHFRMLESEIAAQLSNTDNAVISTGGGMLLNTENSALLRKNGVIGNLEPSEAVIRLRLSKDDGTRPLVHKQSLEQILARFDSRRPYYNNCDFKIEITQDKSIDAAAAEILKKIKAGVYKNESKIRSCRKQ